MSGPARIQVVTDFNVLHPRGNSSNKGEFREAGHDDPGTDVLGAWWAATPPVGYQGESDEGPAREPVVFEPYPQMASLPELRDRAHRVALETGRDPNENLIVTRSEAARAGLSSGSHTIAALREATAGIRFSPAKVRWRRLTMRRLPSTAPSQWAPQTGLDKLLGRKGSLPAGSKCFHGEWVEAPYSEAAGGGFRTECVECGNLQPPKWGSPHIYV